jgi:hypothetical protein
MWGRGRRGCRSAREGLGMEARVPPVTKKGAWKKELYRWRARWQK